ncbi:hypothetical protein [Clostridium felsineum]|uniref:hypothetical protein n=1 Tax=Clostridium felsineum TaxID=36839 RepID=UPI00098C606A|nr:hypothetical protein [Clostridium felsineum]
MIDLDWFFYIAKKHLHYSDEEFWDATPRAILSLWEQHCKFMGWNKNNTNSKGDKINNFNDPSTIISLESCTFL